MLQKGRDGMIDLVLGPMFAGKSTELLRRIKRYRVAEKKCLVIKYAKDTRYSDKCVATHDKQMIEAVSCFSLSEIEEKAQEYDIIGIDEGQFFEEIVEFSETMANLGKTIIIAALDGTFERKPFGRILELIPLAENVTKLDAVCVECNHLASFTKRTCDSKETELIGGDEIYKPVCRGCFYKSKTPEGSPKAETALLSKKIEQAKDTKTSSAEPLKESKKVLSQPEETSAEDKENLINF